MPASMKMDGAMEGMSMPVVDDRGAMNQQPLAAASLGMAGHAAIDAMGPCERQSCEREIVAATGATHRPASLSDLALEFAGMTRPVSGFQALFRGTQSMDAAFGNHERSPLSISLRI